MQGAEWNRSTVKRMQVHSAGLYMSSTVCHLCCRRPDLSQPVATEPRQEQQSPLRAPLRVIAFRPMLAQAEHVVLAFDVLCAHLGLTVTPLSRLSVKETAAW